MSNPGGGTARIERRFSRLADEYRAGLVTYVMAGDPDLDTASAILEALPAVGADIIELGFPFTDPMADGPAIQISGLRALKAGVTLKRTLGLVRQFRKKDSETPLILMGYYNPIYTFGPQEFLAEAKDAGVDGMIIVDLPPEEDAELCLPTLDAGLSFIRLATPTTDDERLPRVLNNTSGFVYYVSITGITGAAIPDLSLVTRRRQAPQASHVAAHRGRFRHQDTGASRDYRPRRGRCRRRLCAGNHHCRKPGRRGQGEEWIGRCAVVPGPGSCRRCTQCP